MQLSTQLDVDLVAVETDDEVTALVELTAPLPASAATRQPATVQVVLDRSGSMSGDRLEHAKRALCELVDRLDPSDNFGLVAFDDEVTLVVPAGPLTDKAAAKHRIGEVYAGGSTDLSAGYLRGLQEAHRVAGPAGATVLVVSDGHANAGVTDPGTLQKVAANAADKRVTTSTIGMGLGYDEQLLGAVATGGRGNEHFAEEVDTAAAVIAGEVDGLLTQVAQAASLQVRLAPEVKSATLLNELPVVGLPDGFMVELGSFYGGETRKLVLTLRLPGMAALGLHQVATLTMTHVSLPELVQHTATLPITVNVVPGDQAAGRVRAPEVTNEALLQKTQRTKRRASKLLAEGNVSEAQRLLSEAGTTLDEAVDVLGAACPPDLFEERRILSTLADETQYDTARASKALFSSAGQRSRKRGSTSTGALVLQPLGGGTPIVVERWEIRALERLAPAASAIRAGAELDVMVAGRIAASLDTDHALHDFFLEAAARGGLTVRKS